jgi:hypothetical protein
MGMGNKTPYIVGRGRHDGGDRVEAVGVGEGGEQAVEAVRIWGEERSQIMCSP